MPLEMFVGANGTPRLIARAPFTSNSYADVTVQRRDGTEFVLRVRGSDEFRNSGYPAIVANPDTLPPDIARVFSSRRDGLKIEVALEYRKAVRAIEAMRAPRGTPPAIVALVEESLPKLDDAKVAELADVDAIAAVRTSIAVGRDVYAVMTYMLHTPGTSKLLLGTVTAIAIHNQG